MNTRMSVYVDDELAEYLMELLAKLLAEIYVLCIRRGRRVRWYIVLCVVSIRRERKCDGIHVFLIESPLRATVRQLAGDVTLS